MVASPTRSVPWAAQQSSAGLGLSATESLTLAPLHPLQLQLRLLRDLHLVLQQRHPTAALPRRPHIIRAAPCRGHGRSPAHPGWDRHQPSRRHHAGRTSATLWTSRRTRPTTCRVHGLLRPPTHLASTALQPVRPHRIKTPRRLRRLPLQGLPIRVVRTITAAWTRVRRRRDGGGQWAPSKSSSRGSPRARPGCRGVFHMPPPEVASPSFLPDPPDWVDGHDDGNNGTIMLARDAWEAASHVVHLG